jgi:hypothetical protein
MSLPTEIQEKFHPIVRNSAGVIDGSVNGNIVRVTMATRFWVQLHPTGQFIAEADIGEVTLENTGTELVPLKETFLARIYLTQPEVYTAGGAEGFLTALQNLIQSKHVPPYQPPLPTVGPYIPDLSAYGAPA